MNKFEMKIQKLENKLALLQWQYGANHFKVSALKKEIKLYRKVCLLSHAEAREQLSFAAGDVKYAKIIGVYPPYSYSFSANKRKLLKCSRKSNAYMKYSKHFHLLKRLCSKPKLFLCFLNSSC